MSEKALLKVLSILATSQKESAKERDFYVRTIKDLTDKIYFIQSKQDYMVSKNMDAIAEEKRGKPQRVESSSDDFEMGKPLNEMSEAELGEALRQNHE